MRVKEEDEAGHGGKSVWIPGQPPRQLIRPKVQDHRILKKRPVSVYACLFAFFISFHFFPALLLLSLYPSWLARKRWLTFPTPHNPVTLCSRRRRRLLLLFFLFFFLQEGSFEASYLASSFSYLAFFFYRSSPLVGFPSLFVIFELPGVLHTYYCQSSWRSRQCTVPERRLHRFHTHTQREKDFPACFRGGYVCSSTVPAFLGPSICYRSGMYLHI